MSVAVDAMQASEKIVVNMDNLTFADLEVIEGWGNGIVPLSQALDVLDKAIEGGVRSRSLSQIRQINEAIRLAIQGATDPNA